MKIELFGTGRIVALLVNYLLGFGAEISWF